MNDTSERPRWFQRLVTSVPTLEREERKDLVGRIEQGAQGGVDYNVMMVLSAGLASFGLLQGSSAVIIGAMLVAPLMGPLVGAGLALVQNNAHLFRKSVGVSGLGLLIGLGVSLLVGLINPGLASSLEIEARGTPDLFDLGVAILSGFVAAYAMGRPGVANTLAGVAIAAALVPPLCVVGLAFTNSSPMVAVNSAILLLTNVVAIILAAALVFKVLGVRTAQKKDDMPAWVRQTLKVLFMIAIILLLPLLLNLVKERRRGPARPLTYPVAPHVQDAVDEYVEQHPNVHLVSMGRVTVEPASDVSIVLSSDSPLPAGFRDRLTELVHEVRGGNPMVRIFAFRELREERAGETNGE